MALKKSDLNPSLWSSCDGLPGGIDATQALIVLRRPPRDAPERLFLNRHMGLVHASMHTVSKQFRPSPSAFHAHWNDHRLSPHSLRLSLVFNPKRRQGLRRYWAFVR